MVNTAVKWDEDFLYGTRLYHKVLDKYKSYFSSIFSEEVVQFGYIRHKKTGEFLGISNLIEHEELYLTYAGYKDDEHQVAYQNSFQGTLLTCTSFYQGESPYALFRQAVKKAFGTEGILCQMERKKGYYDIAWWGLKGDSSNQHRLSELQVYQNYLKKRSLIDLCLKQFKVEVCPIFEKKDLYRVTFYDLKGKVQNGVDNKKKTIEYNEIENLSKKIGFLTGEESFLLQINLSYREEQCLLLCLLGYTSKEISNTLYKSSRTIEDYIKSIKNKLRVKTRKDMFHRANKLKLLGIIGD